MYRRAVAALLVSVFLISSCAKQSADHTSKQEVQTSNTAGVLSSTVSAPPKCPTIKETVEKLSSAGYKGRLVGTEENAAAARELSVIYSGLRLQIFSGNSFLNEYNHDISEQQRQRFGFKENTVTAYNVIGKIPGKNSKKAIVLSAHFDHIGSSGNKIYYGAIDNCSGLAVLLNTAKKLKSSFTDEQFYYDIIISAFNGEEFDLKGSNAFVKSIKNSYESICNINLDSLHGNGDKKLIIVGDATVGSDLINLLKVYLSKYGFECEVVGLKYNGDHLSFSSAGIPSVTLGQKGTKVLHTSEDTPDKIDFDYLDKVSEGLCSFILAQGDKLFC